MQFPGKRQISLNMGCCRLRQRLVNKKGNLIVLVIIGMKLYNIVFFLLIYTVYSPHISCLATTANTPLCNNYPTFYTQIQQRELRHYTNIHEHRLVFFLRPLLESLDKNLDELKWND